MNQTQHLLERLFFSLGLLLLGHTSQAQAEQTFWNLPQTLSDSNVTVSFEVDSTWHMVRGSTKEIAGKAWLSEPTDYRTIRAEVALPVSQFNTDSSRRDTRLREVMHAAVAPEVRFSLTAAPSLCDPSTLEIAASCLAKLEGTLTINSTTREIALPVEITKNEAAFMIEGLTQFKWADFGVEDPSIIVAKLNPTVTVKVAVTLANPTAEAKF